MQDVETLLLGFGFTLARISGSHRIYEFDDSRGFKQITVPVHGHKVKRFYVEQVSDALDELFPVDDEKESTDDDGVNEND